MNKSGSKHDDFKTNTKSFISHFFADICCKAKVINNELVKTKKDFDLVGES